MNCCITELRCKEVIDKSNGCRLGLISDVEVDSCCGRVVALIIFGKPKYWGICGKRERIRICWEDIEVIGGDTVLVTKSQRCNDSRRRINK
ncbi:MAG: YlmC/YmxH family sporulation protein [Clostridia bacterium]|nr:YlmC/YmxH family sporulation protein [Clostridia bacterium]